MRIVVQAGWHRFLLALLSLGVLSWGVADLPRLSAQDPLAAAVSTERAAESPDTVLSRGREFESLEQWGDALELYDRALHRFPDSEALRQRKTLAQIHCDLDRRYEDPSYLHLMSSLTETSALALFDELAVKVRSHHVDEPNWQRLTWRGTANLDIAVTKPAFRRRFLAHSTEGQITAFRQRLRSDVNQRQVRSPADARAIAEYTARIANEQLRLSPACVLAEYCCGGIAALDPYSSYLTGDQLDEIYNQIEGNFVGLGIELKAESQQLRIVKVIKGGPAELAGVHPGETIVAINGILVSQVSPEEAADMLKGEEETVVRLTLASATSSAHDLRVTRKRVEVPSVEDTQILDRETGTAYFRLTSFQKTTSRDVDAALWQLHRDGMRILIIDLRRNPGGLLTASVDVADKFISEGVLVSTRGRSSNEDFDYLAHQPGTWRVPLVVIIDHDTASASEILAGAIRDHGRGTVVGERSYGKGSVQGIFPLNTVRSGVRLTTAKFYSPLGQPISDRGVVPHRPVQVTARPTADGSLPDIGTDLGSDPMVVAALETARQIAVAQRPQP